jgi:hypothetical protein
MTSPLKSRQSPLLLITPGGVDCKIASKLKKKCDGSGRNSVCSDKGA